MSNGMFSNKTKCFLAGAAIAGGAALLLAPQSGRLTRRLLRRKAEDTMEQLTETGREVALRYRDLKKGLRVVWSRRRQAMAA